MGESAACNFISQWTHDHTQDREIDKRTLGIERQAVQRVVARSQHQKLVREFEVESLYTTETASQWLRIVQPSDRRREARHNIKSLQLDVTNVFEDDEGRRDCAEAASRDAFHTGYPPENAMKETASKRVRPQSASTTRPSTSRDASFDWDTTRRIRPQSAKIQRSIDVSADDRKELLTSVIPQEMKDSKWTEMLFRSPDFQQTNLIKLEQETYQLLQSIFKKERAKSQQISLKPRKASANNRGGVERPTTTSEAKQRKKKNERALPCGSGLQMARNRTLMGEHSDATERREHTRPFRNIRGQQGHLIGRNTKAQHRVKPLPLSQNQMGSWDHTHKYTQNQVEAALGDISTSIPIRSNKSLLLDSGAHEESTQHRKPSQGKLATSTTKNDTSVKKQSVRSKYVSSIKKDERSDSECARNTYPDTQRTSAEVDSGTNHVGGDDLDVPQEARRRADSKPIQDGTDQQHNGKCAQSLVNIQQSILQPSHNVDDQSNSQLCAQKLMAAVNSHDSNQSLLEDDAFHREQLLHDLETMSSQSVVDSKYESRTLGCDPTNEHLEASEDALSGESGKPKPLQELDEAELSGADDPTDLKAGAEIEPMHTNSHVGDDSVQELEIVHTAHQNVFFTHCDPWLAPELEDEEVATVDVESEEKITETNHDPAVKQSCNDDEPERNDGGKPSKSVIEVSNCDTEVDEYVEDLSAQKMRLESARDDQNFVNSSPGSNTNDATVSNGDSRQFEQDHESVDGWDTEHEVCLGTRSYPCALVESPATRDIEDGEIQCDDELGGMGNEYRAVETMGDSYLPEEYNQAYEGFTYSEAQPGQCSMQDRCAQKANGVAECSLDSITTHVNQLSESEHTVTVALDLEDFDPLSQVAVSQGLSDEVALGEQFECNATSKSHPSHEFPEVQEHMSNANMLQVDPEHCSQVNRDHDAAVSLDNEMRRSDDIDPRDSELSSLSEHNLSTAGKPQDTSEHDYGNLVISDDFAEPPNAACNISGLRDPEMCKATITGSDMHSSNSTGDGELAVDSQEIRDNPLAERPREADSDQHHPRNSLISTIYAAIDAEDTTEGTTVNRRNDCSIATISSDVCSNAAQDGSREQPNMPGSLVNVPETSMHEEHKDVDPQQSTLDELIHGSSRDPDAQVDSRAFTEFSTSSSTQSSDGGATTEELSSGSDGSTMPSRATHLIAERGMDTEMDEIDMSQCGNEKKNPADTMIELEIGRNPIKSDEGIETRLEATKATDPVHPDAALSSIAAVRETISTQSESDSNSVPSQRAGQERKALSNNRELNFNTIAKRSQAEDQRTHDFDMQGEEKEFVDDLIPQATMILEGELATRELTNLVSDATHDSVVEGVTWQSVGSPDQHHEIQAAQRIQRQYRCFIQRQLIVDQLKFFLNQHRRRAKKTSQRTSKSTALPAVTTTGAMVAEALMCVDEQQSSSTTPTKTEVSSRGEEEDAQDEAHILERVAVGNAVRDPMIAVEGLLEANAKAICREDPEAQASPMHEAEYNICVSTTEEEKSLVSAVLTASVEGDTTGNEEMEELRPQEESIVLANEETSSIHTNAQSDEQAPPLLHGTNQIWELSNPASNTSDTTDKAVGTASLKLANQRYASVLLAALAFDDNDALEMEQTPLENGSKDLSSRRNPAGTGYGSKENDEAFMKAHAASLALAALAFDDAEDEGLASSNYVVADDTATAATDAMALWERYMNAETNKSYYYNPVTQISQWTRPEEDGITVIDKALVADDEGARSFSQSSLDDARYQSVLLESMGGWDKYLNVESTTVFYYHPERGEYLTQVDGYKEADDTGAPWEFAHAKAQLLEPHEHVEAVTSSADMLREEEDSRDDSYSESAEWGEEWQVFIDEATQQPFYYNSWTGESAWERPAIIQGNDYLQDNHAGDDGCGSDCSTQWAMFIDDASGAPYYVNLDTYETSWERPGEISTGVGHGEDEDQEPAVDQQQSSRRHGDDQEDEEDEYVIRIDAQSV